MSSQLNTPVRIGFVGAGGNTRLRHLPGFAALPNIGLVAVANRSRESSEAVARAFGVGRVEADWRAVVEAPDIDAVCIGTWPYLHAEVSCAALAAGKHVLVEARMARNAAEAETMLAASRATPGQVAQVVPAPFTLGVDDTICRRLADGALGDLREVEIVHTHGGALDPAKPLTWRQRSDFSGENMLSLGIHYETILRWLDDDAEVLAARGTTLVKERIDEAGRRRPVDIPDRVELEGRFRRSGARLSMCLSGVEAGPPRNEIRVSGTRGELFLDLDAGRFGFGAPGERDMATTPIAEDGDGWRVEADFVASIRGNRPVTRTSFADGLRYMRFTSAVWRKLDK